jgi:hypothetical protein
LASQLIEICLFSPTAVIRALEELEFLGYDLKALVDSEMNEKQLLELSNTSMLCRCIDLPIADNTPAIKSAD